MIGLYEPLLIAATRAPSGDNTQPWRFVVDADAGTIAVEVDGSRDPSPMNAGLRMARIAAGAAMENLLQASGPLGWDAEVIPAPRSAVAAVRLVRNPGEAAGPRRGVLPDRLTNRRLYDGRPIPAQRLNELAEAGALEGVQTLWITKRDQLVRWASLIGRADALMFGEPTLRRSFLKNVRFDAPADQPVSEGLSLGSLELTRSDRLALSWMPRLPDLLFTMLGFGRVFATKARKLVKSSSGLCLVVAPDRGELTDLIVGRAMQRAWLALSGRGLAAQPMMSLPVLDNALEHGSSALVASLGRGRVEPLLSEARAMLPGNGGRLAFVLRFGYAAPPSGRTGRRPLEAVTVPLGPEPATSRVEVRIAS